MSRKLEPMYTPGFLSRKATPPPAVRIEKSLAGKGYWVKVYWDKSKSTPELRRWWPQSLHRTRLGAAFAAGRLLLFTPSEKT